MTTTRASPTLSIVTTVYDRVECLATCIQSVVNLNFRDWEHVIVADCPPPEVHAALERVVAGAGDPRIVLHNSATRANDFGISPAGFGLRKARGRYLAFLDDDNAYLAEHFDALIPWLESDPGLGFVYSACLYRGERILAAPAPAEGAIDLGQVLFRRELFRTQFGDELRYSGYTWDWQLIRDLLDRGVGYRFVDQQTFIFDLKRYRPFETEALLVKARAGVDQLAAEKAALEARVHQLAGDKASLEAEIHELGADKGMLQSEKAGLQADAAAWRAFAEGFERRCAGRETELAASKAEIAALQAEVGSARSEVRALRDSLIWRTTRPLRLVLDGLLRLAGKP